MFACLILLLLVTCLATCTTLVSSQNPRTGFDLLDSNLRSLIFDKLSPQDLYQMHKAPELKAHVEEFSAGFQRHDDIVKNCRRWWEWSSKSNILDKLYGTLAPATTKDPYESGRYGLFFLNSMSDVCLDSLNDVCREHRNSHTGLELHPLNIIVSHSSEFARLKRFHECPVHLIIEYGELMSSHRFLHALVSAFRSDGNRIFEMTVRNQKVCYGDWAICREVLYNIIPGLHYVAYHFSDANCQVKALNVLEVENNHSEAGSLMNAIHTALTAEMQQLKLDKVDVSGFDLAGLLAYSMNSGPLKKLTLSSISGMEFNDEFWKAAGAQLTSLEISNNKHLLWSDLLSFGDALESSEACSSLESISFKNLNCLEECMMSIIEIAKSSKLCHLKTLDLSELHFTDNLLFTLFDDLIRSPGSGSKNNWERLDLKGSRVSSKATLKRLIDLLSIATEMEVNIELLFVDSDMMDYLRAVVNEKSDIFDKTGRQLLINDAAIAQIGKVSGALNRKFTWKPIEFHVVRKVR